MIWAEMEQTLNTSKVFWNMRVSTTYVNGVEFEKNRGVYQFSSGWFDVVSVHSSVFDFIF